MRIHKQALKKKKIKRNASKPSASTGFSNHGSCPGNPVQHLGRNQAARSLLLSPRRRNNRTKPVPYYQAPAAPAPANEPSSTRTIARPADTPRRFSPSSARAAAALRVDPEGPRRRAGHNSARFVALGRGRNDVTTSNAERPRNL